MFLGLLEMKKTAFSAESVLAALAAEEDRRCVFLVVLVFN